MDCKVAISGADGSLVKAAGKYLRTPSGFWLKYGFGGDECEFSLCGGTLCQKRRGSVDMDISFKEGDTTACVLQNGGLSGSVPVETLSVSAAVRDDGALVRLQYLLGGEERRVVLSVCPTT